MTDRPRAYKTEGVILRRRNIGEADTIFTVFSASSGKFDAIARGVRKARSHMRGHLEPLTRSRLMLARGRSLDVFTQAETIDPYRHLHEDLEQSALGVYCCELIDRFGAENMEQEDVYLLLVDTLAAIDGGAPGHIARYFELQLLALTGYALRLHGCALCNARLPEEDTLISAPAGGLVCIACRARAGTGRIISVRAVKVLRFASSTTLERFAALRIDPDTEHEVALAIGESLRTALDRDPASARYLEQVRRLTPAAERPMNAESERLEPADSN